MNAGMLQKHQFENRKIYAEATEFSQIYIGQKQILLIF